MFWFARPVMLPFVVGAIIAYAFTPFIDAAQARTGRSRLLIVAARYGAGAARSSSRSSLAFAGPVSREVVLLIRSGPDALETALRQVLGADSVTIGDRTYTVEELATQLQAAVNAFLQTPEGALRAAEQLLHGTLDVVLTMIVTFFLLLDGGAVRRTRRCGSSIRRTVSRCSRSRRRIHVVVGQWLRGQLVLVVFVGDGRDVVLGPILHLPEPARRSAS